MEVLIGEERATSEISELDMKKIENKLKKLFPTWELKDYDEIMEIFVNKDDLLSYIQSTDSNKEASNVIVSNAEDSGEKTEIDQALEDILSPISQMDMMTQSVQSMQENLDERNMLVSKLYEALPDKNLKKVLSRVLQLTEQSGADFQREKQQKIINDISTGSVIHYETEKRSYQGLTSIINYL